MKSERFLLLFGFLAGIVLFLTGTFARAENLSTSLAGIVTPSYSGRTIFIYRTPRVLAQESVGGGTSTNGGFTIDASSVPTTAVGVLLHIDAMTDRFVRLTQQPDWGMFVTSPVPLGVSSGTFLLIGDVSDGSNGYIAPALRVYHENNNFYLPLVAGLAHTINWRIVTVSRLGSLKIVCLGYVE